MYKTNYLSHYGILGQKWGVRRFQNPDGTLTAEGRERYAKQMEQDVFLDKKLASNFHVFWEDRFKESNIREPADNGYYKYNKVKSGTIYEEIHNNLKTAREDLKKSLQVAKDFNSNEELVKEYQKKAAKKAWEKYGNKDDPEDLERWEYFYLEEDGDQGKDNSFSIYCKERGLDADKLTSQYLKACDEYKDECEKAVKQILGDYGDKPITYVYGNNPNNPNNSTKSLSDRVSQILTEIAEDEIFEEGYYIPF